MRGRLGSMGNMSSFERVSVLEDEHENSRSFSQGTLGILTLYPVPSESFAIFLLCPWESGERDENTFTFISVSRWIRQQPSSHQEKWFCAAFFFFFPHIVLWWSCSGQRAEQYKRECVYRAVSEPFKAAGSLVVTAVQNVEWECDVVPLTPRQSWRVQRRSATTNN